jgi:hypothetical protein
MANLLAVDPPVLTRSLRGPIAAAERPAVGSNCARMCLLEWKTEAHETEAGQRGFRLGSAVRVLLPMPGFGCELGAQPVLLRWP